MKPPTESSPDAAVAAVTVSRIIPAPPAVLYDCWTCPRRLREWWGADGLRITEVEVQPHVGGLICYTMMSTDGRVYRCTGAIRSMVVPKSLRFTNGFVDEAGEPARHPDLPAWPWETLVTVSFDPVPAGTRVTLTQSVTDADPAAAAGFRTGADGAHEFWAMTLDCLASALEGACQER